MLNANGLRMLPELPPPPPKFSGSPSIVAVPMMVLCSADSVLSCGASAVTVTVSVVEPTSRPTSTRLVMET